MGALLVADLRLGIPELASAVEYGHEAPWCPVVCLLGDQQPAATILASFEPVPGTWAGLYPGDFRHLAPALRASAAVRRRPLPHATTIAQWVGSRVHQPGAASVLAACFGEAGDAVRPPRTLTRRVQALGPLEVRDWRGLARLAQLLAAQSATGARTLETAAHEAMVDPRTLRRWLRLATDLPWREALALTGWEWALESALRRYGYLDRREVLRLSTAGGWAMSVRVP
jgi:hypothetical protein